MSRKGGTNITAAARLFIRARMKYLQQSHNCTDLHRESTFINHTEEISKKRHKKGNKIYKKDQ